MGKTQKAVHKRPWIPSVLVVGLLISMMVTVIAAMIVATMVASERLSESGIEYGAMMATILGAMSGAIYVAAGFEERKWLFCGISGAIYLLLLLCGNALLFDGTYDGIGITTLMIIGCSIAVGLMRMGQRRRSNPVKHRIKNRNVYKMHK